jgi:hypothetical protein
VFIRNPLNIECYTVNVLLLSLLSGDPVNTTEIKESKIKRYKEYFTLPFSTNYQPKYASTKIYFINSFYMRINKLKPIELYFSENVKKIEDYVLFYTSLANLYYKIISLSKTLLYIAPGLKRMIAEANNTHKYLIDALRTLVKDWIYITQTASKEVTDINVNDIKTSFQNPGFEKEGY